MEETADRALERLMDTYGDGILRLCALLLGDPALAEDAAQETMLRAWRGWDAFRGDCTERTWLTAIARNVCRSLLRSPWHTRRTDWTELEALPAPRAEPEDGAVLRAVLDLPVKYREVVVLHYYQELSAGEIGRLLRLSKHTVTTRLRRARERLKPVLKEWYEDG